MPKCGEYFRRFGIVFIGCLITVASFLLGAYGPAHTVSSTYGMSACVGRNVVRRSGGELLDAQSCRQFGEVYSDIGLEDLGRYSVEDVVLMVELPYLNSRLSYSRWFQFMIIDINLSLKSPNYIAKLIESNANFFALDVTIAHQLRSERGWRKLVNGTVIRYLHCALQHYGHYHCDMLPLFELGSLHHQRYLVNIKLRFIPLNDLMEEFKGLSQLSDVSLMEIHQTKGFTQVWWTLKSGLFPITGLLLAVFIWKLGSRQRTLLEGALIFLGAAVTGLGVPVEVLSLYYDCPWLIVFNDVRVGLVVLALSAYWVIFIGEHSKVSPLDHTLGKYWKELAAASLGCIVLFVYEFCERGIQVVYPFFSLWSTPHTQLMANVFLAISITAAALYSVMLLVRLVSVWLSVPEKEKVLEGMAEMPKAAYRRSMSQFKFLLTMLTITAAVTLSTFIPTEIHDFGMEASAATMSVYSGILTGSYALWNVYTVIVLVEHIIGVQDKSRLIGYTAERLLNKGSQE